MIYLKLFIAFLKVGLFSFGGAYGAIPLIRDAVISNEWMDDELFTYMIAVSESTPGPIMVNMATYIGNTEGGFLGALLATVAVSLPAFFIIIIVSVAMKAALENRYVQLALRGLKPCIIGVIVATGFVMILKNCFYISESEGVNANIKTIGLTVFLALIYFGARKIKKLGNKKISPIVLIIISAVCGAMIYA